MTKGFNPNCIKCRRGNHHEHLSVVRFGGELRVGDKLDGHTISSITAPLRGQRVVRFTDSERVRFVQCNEQVR